MNLWIRHVGAAAVLTAIITGCGSGPGAAPSGFTSPLDNRVGISTLKTKQVKVVPIERNKATTTLPNFREGVLLAAFMGDDEDHQLHYAASLTTGSAAGTGGEGFRTMAGGPRRRSVKGIRRSAQSQARATFDAWLERRTKELLARHFPGGRLSSPARMPQLDDRQFLYVSEKYKNDKGEDDYKRVRYPARLKALTPHAYYYVDERYLAPDGSVPFAQPFAEVVKYFEEVAIPVDTRTFGDIPTPPNDVDGDPHVTVFFTKMYEGVVGYFSSIDSFKELESNQRDMIYVGADMFKEEDGVLTMKSTLIHELVHMIVFNYKRLLPTFQGGFPLWEKRFINEGMAVVAEQLGGMGLPAQEPSAVYYVREFLQDNPSAQLTAGQDYLYGTGYLFVLYLTEQYGPEILQKLVKSNKAGIENVELATGRPFAEVFRDWAIALYASGFSDDPRFNFKTVDLRGTYRGRKFDGLGVSSFADFPIIETVTAKPWSIIPIRFEATASGPTLNLSFTGSNWAGLQATLLDTSTMRQPATAATVVP